MKCAHALNAALARVLESDPHALVFGEDVIDPYGGAFKVTRGLSTRFPGRVRATPVSEAAIMGLAAGLSLRGYKPIVEIMFGDFLLLAADQIVNHAAKFRAMYGGRVSCPLVIRTPSGGGRSYGPTHSQSLEKHLFGVPHLHSFAASVFHDPLLLFTRMLSLHGPSLFIEHKLMYGAEMWDSQGASPALARWPCDSGAAIPAARLAAVPPAECRVTLVAYGHQAAVAATVVERLAIEQEIFVDLIVPAQLAPLDLAPIVESGRCTGCVVTVEEGTAGWSWGSEIAARVQAELFGLLRRPVAVLTSNSDVIPASRSAEADMLISPARIRHMLEEVCHDAGGGTAARRQ